MEALIVLSNFPDTQTATRCAKELVERKLAACVNIMPSCVSVYTWKGELETASEIPILVKAQAANFQAIQETIRALHPYELPEINAVAIDNGLPEYLRWVSDPDHRP
jgi:periplasmic divalent cation tolerance protein